MPRRNSGAKLRFREDRGSYYIVWTERGRSRKCSTGTADLQDAQVFLAEWLQSRERSDGPSDPSKIFVTDLLAAYLRARAPKVTAPEVMINAVERLIPFWTGKMVTAATPETCTHYGESRGRANGTVRRELGVLQAAINWGHKNGKLTRTVTVDLPPSGAPRERWLTRQESARLLRAARTRKARLYMPLFILIGIYTGRRKEAILSLRWTQVDLERGVIDFRKPGEPETNKKRGLVRIPKRLLPHLVRARRRGTDLGYVIHDGGKRILNTKKGFEAACRRAGLDGVTPHTMRHTAATWLMQAGVKTWEAAGFLAMSEKTLIKHYGHHHPDHMRDAADAIGRRPGWKMGA